jgi:colicin import membrane protein
VVPPAPADEELAYDDLMEQLRKEAGEEAPGPAAPPSQVAGTGGIPGGGRGALVSPEVMAWMRKAKVHVTRAWVLAPGFRSQPLETEIAVTLGPSGDVRRTRVLRGSGNPWFDESVERAIRKASPLPAPPEAEEWSFVFRPQDLL